MLRPEFPNIIVHYVQAVLTIFSEVQNHSQVPGLKREVTTQENRFSSQLKLDEWV